LTTSSITIAPRVVAGVVRVAGITAAIIAVVWMQLHQAHKDPLLVQVERGDDEVVFVIRRRTWAKAFPAEAARRAAPRREVVRSP